jgi:hypothetical protein
MAAWLHCTLRCLPAWDVWPDMAGMDKLRVTPAGSTARAPNDLETGNIGDPMETPEPAVPPQQIRAVFDATTIRVYQAYSDRIADSALERGTFVAPPFKMERMTWVKPSFLWMMYRAGWGLKEPGQRRILAIDITREGFEWALAHSCPSHADPSMTQEEWERLKRQSPVRVQWDPERDLLLQPLPYRAIQVGLGAEAAALYVKNWIRRITDVTPLAHEIHALVAERRFDEAKEKLPGEKAYWANDLSARSASFV